MQLLGSKHNCDSPRVAEHFSCSTVDCENYVSAILVMEAVAISICFSLSLFLPSRKIKYLETFVSLLPAI